MNSILATDGYKFSMAEAGWPLREETFYYSHRRGGPHYLPFDPVDLIQSILPVPPKDWKHEQDAYFLEKSGYHMGGGYWKAMLDGGVTINALPKGTWFFDREPVFTATGPSALVSWLEPLALQLHYRIQVATLAKLEPGRLAEVIGTVTCDEQRDIVLATLDSIGVQPPEITVDSDAYFRHVFDRVTRLIKAVGDDPTRIFEVGMRAATCMDQHRLALQAAKEAGLLATSNVYLAQELGMKPVGTMGHEHVQRYGSDEVAFRAMRDRFPGASSFLLDTFDTIRSGLPAAFKLIAEDPDRRDTVRFDSGDMRTQYLIACSMATGMGIDPRFILEDSFSEAKTRNFEKLREFTRIRPEDQLYGYGGYIVKAPGDELTRDRVSAVWKLTQTGPTPTMKFGDEPGAGKESIPGRPVVYRRLTSHGWEGLIAQEGEDIPEDEGSCVRLSGKDLPPRVRFTSFEVTDIAKRAVRPAYSPATQALVNNLYAARSRTVGSL